MLDMRERKRKVVKLLQSHCKKGREKLSNSWNFNERKMKRSSCNANEKEEEKSCDVLIASMGEGE
jgi:hypothetical protein